MDMSKAGHLKFQVQIEPITNWTKKCGHFGCFQKCVSSCNSGNYLTLHFLHIVIAREPYVSPASAVGTQCQEDLADFITPGAATGVV